MSRHSLVLGGTLDLTADTLHGCKLSVLGQDMSLGSPMPIESAVRSLIQDGAILRTQGYENAEVAFNIMIEGPDSIALAQAEAAIVGMVGKPTTLEWTPPDGLVTSVYTIQSSRLQQSFDDMDEVGLRRRFVLVLTRLPWARSKSRVVESLSVAGDTGTIIDACDSTTGWASRAGSGGGAPIPVALDTAVKAQGTASVRVSAYLRSQFTDQWGWGLTVGQNYLTRTGLSVAVTAGSYLSVLVLTEWGDAPGWPRNYIVKVTSASGTRTVSAQPVGTVGPGFVQIQWQADRDETITALSIEVHQFYFDWVTSNPRMWVDRFQVATTAHTAHQSTAVKEIRGSVPAPGSLQIKAVTGLGQVLVMTMPEAVVPAGFDPAVRRHRVSGTNPVTDSNTMSGQALPLENNPSGATVFDVPVGLLSAGTYSLVVRARNNGTGGAIAASAILRIGGIDVGAPVTTRGALDAGSSSYQMVSIGELPLPPTPILAPENAVVRLRIWGDVDFAWLDDAWLCPTTAELSLVDCGAGTPSASGASSHLWIDTPSPEYPMGAVWRGHQDARQGARSALADTRELGRHRFHPPRTRIVVVTTGSTGAQATADYAPHWHTNAAE